MSILRIRDASGNFVAIPSIRGDKGEKGDKGDAGGVTERTQEEMDADEGKLPAPEMTDTELLLATAADHEYRLCLMELGVTEE